MEKLKKYYIYILRCKDDSLYTGITTDIERRYEEHLEGKGAKYTRNKGIKKLEICFSCNGRSEASKIEYLLKKITRDQKERFILDFKRLEEYIEKNLNLKIKKENIFQKNY